MPQTRIILIGGFLGAGKTTTLRRLAEVYRQRGQRVGIITNDQAADLVDTHLLRSAGYEVVEVAGSCFCCNFTALHNSIEELQNRTQPHVVLAEPVGSCTDIVATVIRPLQRLHGDEFDVAPYGVIVKDGQGSDLIGSNRSAFSDNVAYLFAKQIEEADFAIINRADELAADEIERLKDAVWSIDAHLPIHTISAKTGQGFDVLVDKLAEQGSFGTKQIDVDYDAYAQGESELGWLNGSFHIIGQAPLSLDDLCLNVVDQLRQTLNAQQSEPAHLKAVALADDSYAAASVVDSSRPAAISQPASSSGQAAKLIINARAAMEPQALVRVVEDAVRSTAAQTGASSASETVVSFRPGRPVPTYRE